MKRFTFLKSLVMLFALCLISTGAAWAQTEQTVTFDIPSYGVSQKTSLADHPLTEAPITVSAGEGGTTPLRFWGSGASSSLRIYQNNKLIISAQEGAEILKVVFNKSLSNFSVSDGDLSGTTWTGNASEITFTKNNKGNVEIGQIDVTYATAAGFVAPPTFSLEEGTYNLGQSHELEITADEGTTIHYALNGDDTYNEYTRPILLNKTTTVSAYAEDAEGNRSEIVEATYTFEISTGDNYQAISSAADIVDGGKYLIVAESESEALSSAESKYRNAAAVDIFNQQITNEVNAEGLPYVITFELVEGNTYKLYDETLGQYLASGSSTDTDLKSNSDGNSNNAHWTVTFDNGIVHIVSEATNTREIKHNTVNGNGRFGNYTSTGTQQPVTLYKKAAAATTGNFTIGKAGYATFFTDWTFVMPEGVEGGIVTEAAEGNLTVDYHYYPAGSIVPANTGLLLKGAAKTYTYNLSTETPDAPKVNYLKGSVDAAKTEGEGCLFYMLSYDHEGKNLGFYWGEEDGAAFENGAGKAYLALPQAVASQVRGFVLDGTTTGISGVTTEANNAPAAVYSLTGVRMGTTTDGLPAGIYIVNGKKVLVK